MYAYYGSKFDNLAIIYEILARTTEVPTDVLESNGKMIRFQYQGLVFLDLCLITMSTLASACNAYGIPTQKGDFPHRLLQNLQSQQAIIDALDSTTTWGGLEPYIDWFSTESPEDLQKRKIGQSHEEWRDQMPLRKYWREHRAEAFPVREKCETYLRGDVNALWELTEKVSIGMAGYGCNARSVRSARAPHASGSRRLKKTFPKSPMRISQSGGASRTMEGFADLLGLWTSRWMHRPIPRNASRRRSD